MEDGVSGLQFPWARLLVDAVELDRAGNALDLRLARLLAVIKRMDLAPLGYGTFRAFCEAEAELKSRRIAQLVALVECPFARVREAVVTGRLAVSVAARGIGEIDAESEEAWLEEALAGRLSKPEPPPKVEFTGEEVREIHEARTLARLNIGQAVGDDTADRHVLEAWREKRSREQLLDEARRRPSPPAPLPAWEGADPAEGLVGPWVDPEGPEDARRLLHEVTRARKERIVRLGEALEHIAQREAWRDAGFASFERWVKRSLRVSFRTVQRYRKALLAHPGLDVQRALFVEEVGTDDTREEWAAIVPHVPVAELRQVRLMAERGEEQVLREGYLRALARLEERVGAEATKGAKVRFVSLAATLPPPKAPRSVESHPDILEAARWYLEQGRTPAPKGLGYILHRDWFTCTNPECRARHMRVHGHHDTPRAEGGSDEASNLYTLCPACHLRLRHSGHMDSKKDGEWLLFSFKDREIWMHGHEVNKE